MDFDFKSLIAGKSDEELAEIYVNRENYNKQFFELANEELVKRGIEIEPIEDKRRLKVADESTVLSEGKRGNPTYLFICFVLALLGGLIGIVAGYTYAYSKTTGYGGEKYYVYDDSTRSWGRVIFYLGLAAFIVAILLKSGSLNFDPGKAY